MRLPFDRAERLAFFRAGSLDARAIIALLAFLAADIARAGAVRAAIGVARKRIGARHDALRAHASDVSRITAVLACAARAQLAWLAGNRCFTTRIGGIELASAILDMITGFALPGNALAALACARFPAFYGIAALMVVIAAIVDIIVLAIIPIEMLALGARRTRHAFPVGDIINIVAFCGDAFRHMTFVFNAVSAETVGIGMAFGISVDNLARPCFPAVHIICADNPVTAAVVLIIVFAMFVVKMLGGVARCLWRACVFVKDIALAFVAFGCYAFAAHACARKPAFLRRAVIVRPAAAFKRVRHAAIRAFINMLACRAALERHAPAVAELVICHACAGHAGTVFACACLPAIDALGAVVIVPPAVLKVIGLALAVMHMLVRLARDRRAVVQVVIILCALGILKRATFVRKILRKISEYA